MRKVVTPKCRYDIPGCQVLNGTRSADICAACKLVSQGKSIQTDKELFVPSNYVSGIKATVHQIRRK